MGLDVTAYSKLTKVETVTVCADDGEFYGADAAVIEDGWSKYMQVKFGQLEIKYPATISGLSGEGVYSFEMSTDLHMNYPAVEFWRDNIERMCDLYDLPIDQFVVHLWHGDFCGPRMAYLLAFTFAAHKETAQRYAEQIGKDGEWFLRKYNEWAAIYELAANNGVVHYH